MIILDSVVLRMPESEDVPCLYAFRNDWEVAQHLLGFSPGYSRAMLENWIKQHTNRSDEIVWAIADRQNGACIGHVGLYQIDYRARKAEFAIVIGDRQYWGKGLGTSITEAVVDWGFAQLNLNKITLMVLTNNGRALHMYEKLGFCREGLLHDEQFRNGAYMDLILMAVFASDWKGRRKDNAE